MPNIGQFFYLSNQLTLLRLVFIPFVVLTILYARYETALILVLIAGLTDGMDGLLARRLGQQTTLGQFLDPIADKLLLNSAFIALVASKELPLWLVILVFSRDMIILATSLVMLLVTTYRPFRPSAYGKATTVAQVATVLFALAALVFPGNFLEWLRTGAVYTAAGFTVASGLQYAWLTGERLRGSEELSHGGHPAAEEPERERREEESPIGRNRLH
jgi:cardiolipin synthase